MPPPSEWPTMSTCARSSTSSHRAMTLAYQGELVARVRSSGETMPRKIGYQNESVASQLGCNAPPGEVRVAKPVQKDDWGTASGPAELEPVNAHAVELADRAASVVPARQGERARAGPRPTVGRERTPFGPPRVRRRLFDARDSEGECAALPSLQMGTFFRSPSRRMATLQGVFLNATCRHERCTASFVRWRKKGRFPCSRPPIQSLAFSSGLEQSSMAVPRSRPRQMQRYRGDTRSRLARCLRALSMRASGPSLLAYRRAVRKPRALPRSGAWRA